MRSSWLVLVALLCGCPSRHVFPQLVERSNAGDVVVLDVAVFDGVSATRLEHQDVFTHAGRIVRIAPHSEEVPNGVDVIDGRGKTLLPGLVDIHVHLTGSAAPPWHVTWPDPNHSGAALLYSGVTTAMDVGGQVDEISELAARKKAGTWLGPDFIYAGTMITARGGYPASMVRDLFPWPVSAMAEGRFAMQVGTEQEAIAAVETNLAHGATIIKVGVAQVPLDAPVFTPELLIAVVKAAHARGVKVVAHTDSAEHAMLAARSGVDALVHGVHLGEFTEAQAAELKALGTTVAPTLVVWDRAEQLLENRYVSTVLEQEIFPEDFLQHFRPEVTKQHRLTDGLMLFLAKLRESKPQRIEAVKRMYAAGIPLLVGADDAGSVGCMTGAAFHEEMRQLVEAGLSNVDVLRGATSGAAKFMGGDFGVIKEGAKADLLLVEGNPLEDISAISHISAVVQNGQRLVRLKQ